MWNNPLITFNNIISHHNWIKFHIRLNLSIFDIKNEERGKFKSFIRSKSLGNVNMTAMKKFHRFFKVLGKKNYFVYKKEFSMLWHQKILMKIFEFQDQEGEIHHRLLKQKVYFLKFQHFFVSKHGIQFGSQLISEWKRKKNIYGDCIVIKLFIHIIFD